MASITTIRFSISYFFCMFCFFSTILPIDSSSSQCPGSNLSTYIFLASTSHKPIAFSKASHWYASAVASVTSLPLHRSIAHHGPFYTYQHVVHGFSARLNPCHVMLLLEVPGFIHAFPERILQLHTTHTPEFLHLPTSTFHEINTSHSSFPAVSTRSISNTLHPRPSSITTTSASISGSFDGEDVIVGVIDTGVWPERLSFTDKTIPGFDDIPSRWQGECEAGQLFDSSNCNKKLIGARAFFKSYESAYGPIDETSEYKSARDSEGHGSHTSSTVLGNVVANASLFGFAPGYARGMAPRARLAVYKVCWEPGCFDGDILAAFDAAVADGVDIISLSVGGSVVPLYEDSIALGSFGAMQKGVLVSCSAGNSGPYAGSVSNIAPWVITVAASTIDRTFPAPVTLGDGSVYQGVSVYGGKSYWEEGQQISLVYAGDVGLSNSSTSNLCTTGSLDPDLVRGKIVLCERGTNARVGKGLVVSNAGGVGMILVNTAESGSELIADSHLIPATLVGFTDGIAIKAYIAASGANATATITLDGTTELGVKPAPAMAAFSSRGPNPLPEQILKPDLTGPGVNILAAYTGTVGPTGLDSDDRIVDFSIMSGTSMSCPHVSGLATLIKSIHPTWSPAAIKSALMTTASVRDNTGHLITDTLDGETASLFAYGAGHVDPLPAIDPGLVYDLGLEDYIHFLCSLGYRDGYLEVFTKGEYRCSRPDFSYSDLNYPSFAHVFHEGDNSNVSFPRTATNVGNSSATYNVFVDAPSGVNVKVEPDVLEFDLNHVTRNYTVTFQLDLAMTRSKFNILSSNTYTFGSLTWTDGVHTVRSPIAITFQAQRLTID